MTGTIKALRDTFGFIKGSDGKDYFFHGGSTDRASGLQIRDLAVNDTVVFDVEDGRDGKGPRATEVRRA